MTSDSPHTDALVIGAGFAGIAAATKLALLGKSVTVVERHHQAGGRARQFTHDGFVFDMGPSWYWMPDVFEEFFQMAGTSASEHLDLVRLDPSYRTWFADGPLDIPAGQDAVEKMFEAVEPGAGERLNRFLAEAGHKYRVGMNRFVRKPGHSPLEFLEPSAIPDMLRLSMFGSLSSHVRQFFTDPKLIQLLEFPVLFLGARPEKTPALYSMMNYADTVLGTWYPMGGMHGIVEAMTAVARKAGVNFVFGADVQEISVHQGKASGVVTQDGQLTADVVIAAADYHHVEQHLLPAEWRRYDETYWDKRVLAPSSLLFYLGVDCRVPELKHHNLFFDVQFEPHAKTIYDEASWPDNPMFYACVPSRTDPSVAPEGSENVFILIPLAPGLEYDQSEQERLFGVVMDRLASHTGKDLRPHITVRRDYAHREFNEDYRAFKGNAYGLANTLTQTAFLKPKMKSKLPGLFFAGQLTTPGPGVPPSLISGQVAAVEADKWLNGAGALTRRAV